MFARVDVILGRVVIISKQKAFVVSLVQSVFNYLKINLLACLRSKIFHNLESLSSRQRFQLRWCFFHKRIYWNFTRTLMLSQQFLVSLSAHSTFKAFAVNANFIKALTNWCSQYYCQARTDPKFEWICLSFLLALFFLRLRLLLSSIYTIGLGMMALVHVLGGWRQ